jgi:hypothetical protein
MATKTAEQLGGQVYGDAAARTEAQKRALLTEVAQTGAAATQRGEASLAQAEALKGMVHGIPGAENAARVTDPQTAVTTARGHETEAFNRAMGAQQTSMGNYMDAVTAALPIEQSRSQSQAAMIYQAQIEAEEARRAALEQQRLQLQMAREAQAAAREAAARQSSQGDLARERFELEKEEMLRRRAQEDQASQLNTQLSMLRQHAQDLTQSAPGGFAGKGWQGQRNTAQLDNVAQQIAALEAQQQQSMFGPMNPMDQRRYDMMGLEQQAMESQLAADAEMSMWANAVGSLSGFNDPAKLERLVDQIARQGAHPGSILGDLNRQEKEAVLSAVNTFNQQLAREQGVSNPQQWTLEITDGQSGVSALKERFPSGARKLASTLFGLGG